MTPFIQQLLQQVAGQGTSALMGLGIQGINDRRQRRQQRELQDIQIEGQKEMTRFNTEKAYQMWKDTNYPAQVEMIKKAGLNPGLLYGMSGGGGTTANIPTGSTTGGSAPQGGREIQDMIGMGINYELVKAQKELIQAQAENVKADTLNKPKTGLNIDADTQNKILQQVITKYTGAEAKDVYERVTSPNRSIQAKTYEDEMSARQGLAGTIYDLWLTGKLEEKSLSEIEQLSLQNAKTREETKNIIKQFDILEENLKGVKLDNIIKELETKLQTETGIDKNSPTWLKILGRLFVGLLNK